MKLFNNKYKGEKSVRKKASSVLLPEMSNL